MRPIRELGDPVLRTPSDDVRAFDGWLAALVKDLLETVDHPGRAGLAAPQIGVSVRAFSYNIDGEIGHLVNPTIVELSEETQDGDEGRSEEHTSELQSRQYLVCRLLLEKQHILGGLLQTSYNHLTRVLD